MADSRRHFSAALWKSSRPLLIGFHQNPQIDPIASMTQALDGSKKIGATAV
jgi:hypothetical protein